MLNSVDIKAGKWIVIYIEGVCRFQSDDKDCRSDHRGINARDFGYLVLLYETIPGVTF